MRYPALGPVAERLRRALGVARFERQAVDDGCGLVLALPSQTGCVTPPARSPSDAAARPAFARLERQAADDGYGPAARPAASDRMRDPALGPAAERLRRAL
jgi:hypothetical protein